MSLRDEIAKRYPVDRNGWFLCPNHKDRKPSCHVFIATKGKHKGQEIFFCQVCKDDFMGDAADWQEYVTGRKGQIQEEDPEVRRLRLADERVRKECDHLEHLFHNRYPDTPDEVFRTRFRDMPVEAQVILETVQKRLEAARLGG